MIGATFAWEWGVIEVVSPLVTNRPGEACIYMFTLVANEGQGCATTAGEKYTI